MRVQDEDAVGRAPRHRVPQELRPAQEDRHPRPRAGRGRRQHRDRLRAHRPAPRGAARCACSTGARGTRCRRTRWRSSRRSTRGSQMDFLVAPVRVIKDGGRVTGLECLRMELGEPDAERTAQPEADPRQRVRDRLRLRHRRDRPGDRRSQELVDGQVPNFLPLRRDPEPHPLADDPGQRQDLRDERRGGLLRRRRGDRARRPPIEAIAAGRKAAHAIDTYIRDRQGRSPSRSSSSAARTPSARSRSRTCGTGPRYARSPMPVLPPEERVKAFVEVEQGYTAEDLEAGEPAAASSAAAPRSSTATCGATRPSTRSTSAPSLGEAKEYRVDRTPPADRARPEQVHPLRPLRADLQRGRGRGRLRLHQPRASTRSSSRPWAASLLETDCVSCGLCIGTCPTGAIAEQDPAGQARPLERRRRTPTVCHYCGVGCRLNYDTFGDSLVKISRARRDGPTDGNHCKKGRFGYHYVQAAGAPAPRHDPRRARAAGGVPRRDDRATPAMRLKELTRRYSGDEIAVFVSPRLTNEEIYLAQKFARRGPARPTT